MRMRIRTVSVLCFLVSLICSPFPLAAQSNSSSSSPNPQNPPASAKLLELPRAAETGTVPAQTDSTKQLMNPPQSWNLFAPKNESNADHLWSFKKGILPQLETSRCAHIVIFQAPNIDSEMIVEAPPGLGGNMTIYRGLQPCCHDLRGPLDALSIAPKAPGAQPPFLLPKKHGLPAPNFENWPHRLQP